MRRITNEYVGELPSEDQFYEISLKQFEKDTDSTRIIEFLISLRSE